jgi:hypothetical protein
LSSLFYISFRRVIKEAESIFGRWDYLAHQVLASPFKPVIYMDRMDVFGYTYIKGTKIINKYLVVEIKNEEAYSEAIEQTMKYVDWIKDEYCHGDYSMISAFILAPSFNEAAVDTSRNDAIRQFTINRRPPKTASWNNIKLVIYKHIKGEDHLHFSLYSPEK